MNEMMAQFETDSIRVTCFDITLDESYHSSYYIKIKTKAWLIPSYAYFEDLNDMFYFYDILKKEGQYLCSI